MKTFLLFAVALLIVAGCGAPPPVARSSDEELRQYAQGAAVVLDVRTPEEYAAGHVSGATNVPVSEVKERIGSVVPNKQTPIMVHCQSGRRSAMATQTLKEMGYARVYNLGSLDHAREVTSARP